MARDTDNRELEGQMIYHGWFFPMLMRRFRSWREDNDHE